MPLTKHRRLILCKIVFTQAFIVPVSHGLPQAVSDHIVRSYNMVCNDGGAWSVVARTIKCEVTLYSSSSRYFRSPCSSPASYRLVVRVLKTAHRRPPVLSVCLGFALSWHYRRGRTLCEARISKRSHEVSHLREATGIANCGMMVHIRGR